MIQRKPFWKHKSLDQLKREQGVRSCDVSELMGAGADLWDDDADFEACQKWLREKRELERGGCSKSLER